MHTSLSRNWLSVHNIPHMPRIAGKGIVVSCIVTVLETVIYHHED